MHFGRKPASSRHKVTASSAAGRRRCAGKTHRTTRELHDKIIEFLPDPTFVIDRNGSVIAWNRAIEEMTLIRKEDILGKSGYAYAMPFYGEPRPILIDLVLAGDARFEEMYDYMSRDENTLYAEVYSSTIYGGRGACLWGKASPLFDESGRIAGAIESIRDVTDRKQAECELQNSRERLEILFEYAPDAAFLIDPEGCFVAANKAAEAMTGYARADVAGRNLFELDFMTREDVPKALDILERNSLNQNTGPAEFTVIRKDGSRIVVEIRTYPTRIEGQLLLLGSARDITARKRAEAALKESEGRLRFLSSRLLTAQEEERKRIAADLHDSIGSYLTGIKLGLENFLEQPDPRALPKDSLKALIAITQGALEETRRIITDLRPSILDDLGIVATISWFCRQFRALHPDITIDERVTIDEREVPGNLKIIIFRIIQEAVNNAAKYSRAKLLNLSLGKTRDAVQLIVEDFGEGFDVSAATSRCGRKRGMGLTGMKERAELSAGSFSIRSAPGAGTKICATWPLKPARKC